MWKLTADALMDCVADDTCACGVVNRHHHHHHHHRRRRPHHHQRWASCPHRSLCRRYLNCSRLPPLGAGRNLSNCVVAVAVWAHNLDSVMLAAPYRYLNILAQATAKRMGEGAQKSAVLGNNWNHK